MCPSNGIFAETATIAIARSTVYYEKPHARAAILRRMTSLRASTQSVDDFRGEANLAAPRRDRTVGNGMPPGRSYRSARRNQKANPPVLWLVPGSFEPALPEFELFFPARTPKEPFLPVFCQPRRSMIIRTTTPTACRIRLVRRGDCKARNRSTSL